MPKCNINKKGQMVRFIVGIILFFVGSVMFVIAVQEYGTWLRVLFGALMLIGVFIMVEGVLGWCALRAMGFKTKI